MKQNHGLFILNTVILLVVVYLTYALKVMAKYDNILLPSRFPPKTADRLHPIALIGWWSPEGVFVIENAQ